MVGDIIFIELRGLNIFYEKIGEGPSIILLHGWGANHLTFKKLMHHLSSNFTVYAMDLPGFGESQIGVPVDLDENVNILRCFIEELKIDNPILLGHSYGGRISIMYASLYDVHKLVLVSSAGIKQKLKLNKRIKIRLYKILKKCNIKLSMGSKDFQDADNVKKIMLVKTVNLDLTEHMKKVECPTLLIYGDNDKTTPLTLARQIEVNIKHSSLIIMEECGHFPYLDRSAYFHLILDSFIVGDHE